MIILGIDPGYERLGLAIIKKDGGKKEELLYSNCYKTDPKLDFEKRLFLIIEEIEKIIKEYKPDILSRETLFFSNNSKTAMRVSETRGAIIYCGVKNNLKIIEINPSQIKLAITGNGKSDKTQIIKMVQLILNFKKKAVDDEYDAISCALTAIAINHL